VRLVIYGAGAIGGVLGARLDQHGSDVTFVARGANYDALATRGLRVQVGDDETTLSVSVVRDAGALDLAPDDAVFLTMKSNDTREVIDGLERVAPQGSRLSVRRMASRTSDWLYENSLTSMDSV
jgi:2-dehydropantoate 2-reductase